MIEISNAQARVVAELLDLAGDEFSNHNCNDYDIDYTPENIEFVEEMFKNDSYNDDEETVDSCFNDDKTKIYLTDWTTMGYCSDMLLKKVEEADEWS